MLLDAGYEVFGTTRSKEKAKTLEALGVSPVVLDVYDYATLEKTLLEIKPELVYHQLTDQPDGLEEEKMKDALESNAKLRDEGTRNLVNASTKSEVKKMIAQSIAFVYEPAPLPFTEESKLLNFEDEIYGSTSKAVYSLEQQVLNASFVGIVLRNALLYGKDTGFNSPIEALPCVNVDAAVKAAFLAKDYSKNGVFNIGDDDNRLSSQKAKDELGFDPNFRIEA